MIGLFGKTSAHGDFIKVNASSKVVHAFVSWLTEGVELLRQSQTELPLDPVGFLFAGGCDDNVLVGAFVRSQDKVGREFPLVIFTTVDALFAAQNSPIIPRIYDGFLNDAVGILMSAQGADVSSLKQWVQALREPGESELAQAQHTSISELGILSMGDFQRQLGNAEQGGHYYAFHALLSACRPLRGKAPPTTGVITLECPIVSAPMCSTWLQLAKSSLQWSSTPSFFWTSSLPQRLLLSLGSPGPAVLKYIAGADPNAAKLWPLQTTNAGAIDAARQALPSTVLRAIDRPDDSINHLLALIANA